MSYSLTASLVVYNSPVGFFYPAVKSYLSGTHDGVLVISDNSDNRLVDDFLKEPRLKYIYNNSNLGFGAAHNAAIFSLRPVSDFHLILNPDVVFDAEVIGRLAEVLKGNPSIGALMPKIVYPDGSLQRLCKLLPSPVDLLLRRFVPIPSVQSWINNRYEMHGLAHRGLVEVPSLSGCFLMVRTELFIKIGGFDERFFMYLEDVDLVRRIGEVATVAYYADVSVTHAYMKGSYRNKKLLMYHIYSAFRYFCKWGWFFDRGRSNRNKNTSREIRF